MWTACLCLSFGCFVAAVLLSVIMGSTGLNRKWGWNLFHVLVAGVFCGTLILFLPVHSGGAVEDLLALWRTALLSVFTSIQVFAAGCEFGQITENMASCPEGLVPLYTAWSATLYVLAPVFTFGFILSLFRNLTAYLRYLSVCFRDVYIFSDLNEGAMALAEDIRKNHPDAAVVFTDVFEENEEQSFELVEQAGKIGAICFKKDILVVNFGRHSGRKNLFFFTIGASIITGQNMMGLKKLFKIPATVACLISIVIYFSPFRFPVFVQDTFSSVGGMMAPTAMILIGSSLAEIPVFSILKDRCAYLVSALRLIVYPFAILFILRAIPGVPPTVALHTSLMFSVPTGTMCQIYAYEYNCNPEFAARTLVQGTLLMIVTIPIFMTCAISLLGL